MIDLKTLLLLSVFKMAMLFSNVYELKSLTSR